MPRVDQVLFLTALLSAAYARIAFTAERASSVSWSNPDMDVVISATGYQSQRSPL